MRRQAYIRPSRLSSGVGAVVGIFMSLFGIGVFLVMISSNTRVPAGAYLFMAIWLCAALGGTIYNIYNASTGNGFAGRVIEYDDSDPPRDPESFQNYSVVDRLQPTSPSADTTDSTANRLRQLQDLFNQGLVTRAEFEQKRQEILNDL